MKIFEIIFYLISFLLIFLPFWFKKKFGVVYFDQLIFHLELFFKGNLVADAQVQKSLYKWLIISSVLSTYVYLFFKDLNCPEKSTTCVPKCGDDVKSFQNVSSQLLCAGEIVRLLLS